MTDENIVNDAAQEGQQKIDPELEAKHKTLALLTHAAKCTATENGRFACTFYHCKAGKAMLQHVVNCQLPPGCCPIPFCAMAKYVLANSSEIQVQMAKANKRGRGFQRTMLSSHRAMTASVVRTRSRSGSRGPPTQRRPLATVYESNDEGEDNEGPGLEKEDNRTIRTAPGTSTGAFNKSRISDSSGTAETDSSDEDSSEGGEGDQIVAPAVSTTGFHRPSPRGMKGRAPNEEDSDSDSSSDDDDEGFGLPGSFPTPKRNDASDSDSSDDDDEGFGSPGTSQSQGKIFVSETSSSDQDDDDDDDFGFGAPGTSLNKEPGKEADRNFSNGDTVDRTEGKSMVPYSDSSYEGFGAPEDVPALKANEEGKDRVGAKAPEVVDDWSSDEEEELKTALANRDTEVALQLMNKQNSDDISDVPSTGPAEPKIGEETRSYMISNVEDNQAPNSQEKESVQLNSDPPAPQLPGRQPLNSAVDDCPSDEDEELKTELANRDTEIAQQLLDEADHIAKDYQDMRKIPLSINASQNGKPTDASSGTESDAICQTVKKEAEDVGRWMGIWGCLGTGTDETEVQVSDRAFDEVTNDTADLYSRGQDLSTKQAYNFLSNEGTKGISADVTTSVTDAPMYDSPDHSASQEADSTPHNSSPNDIGTDGSKHVAPVLSEVAEEDVPNGKTADEQGIITETSPTVENRDAKECTLPPESLTTNGSQEAVTDSSTVYKSVQYKNTAGSLTLGSEYLCFMPGSMMSDSASVISWSDVAKQQASMPSSTNSHSASAQLISWSDVAKQQASPPKNASLTPGNEYSCVMPSSTKNHSASAQFISWSDVAKHQVSPPKNAKAMLKVTLTDGKSMAFGVKDRTVLEKLQGDTEKRLAHHNSFESQSSSEQSILLRKYEPVRFKSVVGSVLLLKDSLLFQPSDNPTGTDGGKLTLSWIEVSKHKVSPATHAKALLKLMLTSGKSLTFEFEGREDLIQCRKDITSVLHEYRAAANAVKAIGPTVKESIYKPVRFRSMIGAVVLRKGSLVYTPNEVKTPGATRGVKFTLGWGEVSKHKVSPATHEKHLLKFMLTSGKALTFELESRIELVKARRDVAQLLQDHQQQQQFLHPGSDASLTKEAVAKNNNS